MFSREARARRLGKRGGRRRSVGAVGSNLCGRVGLVPQLLEGAQVLGAQVLDARADVRKVHDVVGAEPLETVRLQRGLPSIVVGRVDRAGQKMDCNQAGI